MVGIKALPGADIVTKIHIKRWYDHNVIMTYGKQRAKQAQTLLRLAAAGQVIVQAQILCAGPFLQDLRIIVCVIQQPCSRFFLLRHLSFTP